MARRPGARLSETKPWRSEANLDGDVLDRVTFFYDAWGSAPGGPAKSKPHNRLALLSYGLDSMAVDKVRSAPRW
eukprot:56273-Chlamydomonas_euryale.AAC.1